MGTQNWFTLITGASHGIGKSLCHEFASRGYNLFLIALPNQLLIEVEKELNAAYNVEIVTFGIDLTKEDSPQQIKNFAEKSKIKVNVLINNAGMGSGGLFENSNMQLNKYIMMLNNHAMVGIIHAFIPDLKESAPSYIMNISSMEATLPLPYKAVYTATKNFIFSFSLAISQELKPDKVYVSVVCPGSVATNEDGMKRIKAMGWKAKLLLMEPDVVAKIMIKNMFKRKLVIIPGTIPSIMIWIMYFIPVRLKLKILEKIFRAYRDHNHRAIEPVE